MIGVLKNSLRKIGLLRGPTYETAKSLARHHDSKVRERLARSRDVRPEILYFLAEDADAGVRGAVAANAATPRHADMLLVRDKDEDVRSRLAEKIGRLAPELSETEREDIRRMTIEAMEILARDEAIRVRRILAETLKDVANAPPSVVRQLARDAELQVAAPVLEFSPVLSDEDLLEIIRTTTIEGTLSAISRRQPVRETIAEAIVERDETDAIAELLGNSSAQIREETLDHLIERARRVEAWHEPLVRRANLPVGAMRKLASYVSEKMLAVLDARDDLDPEAVAMIKAEVHRRLGSSPPADGDGEDKAAVPEETPQELHAAGRLDVETVADAVKRGEYAFVVDSLCLLGGLPRASIEAAIGARSAKGITAMAWKAGLPMRLAADIQTRICGIQPGQVLLPRNGTDYPLSEEQLRWELEFFDAAPVG
jgi:uncharacterized protein (DUF2336 family)